MSDAHGQPVIDLSLPEGDSTKLHEASKAVKTEYQASIRWKKLRCRNVIPLPNTSGEGIFILEVAQSLDFDWTWEGAKAFRPKSLDDNGKFSDAAYEEADYQDEILWSGEILEALLGRDVGTTGDGENIPDWAASRPVPR